eukprot:TRINITY_DN9153_c0_g1_i1.p1 TRINITY_DN9153_c0_g1~~TRINITY_DN9153_c0_g1_i1.p1  ORF type:complete len:468 (+),score=107.82 TRINITY_DN9153_c0_g1_i1:105-1508(+)
MVVGAGAGAQNAVAPPPPPAPPSTYRRAHDPYDPGQGHEQDWQMGVEGTAAPPVCAQPVCAPPPAAGPPVGSPPDNPQQPPPMPTSPGSWTSPWADPRLQAPVVISPPCSPPLLAALCPQCQSPGPAALQLPQGAYLVPSPPLPPATSPPNPAVPPAAVQSPPGPRPEHWGHPQQPIQPVPHQGQVTLLGPFPPPPPTPPSAPVAIPAESEPADMVYRGKGGRKLFVGQLPKTMRAVHLRKLMSPFGDIADVHVMRDRQSGRGTGAAFVVYRSPESAQRAIQHFDGRVRLEGVDRAMHVRLAEGELGPERDVKLFVGQLSPALREEDITPWFEPYGGLLECAIIRKDGQSRGCAFVRYASRAAAQRCIAELNGTQGLSVSPGQLLVRFADTEAEKRKRRTAGQRAGHDGELSTPSKEYSSYHQASDSSDGGLCVEQFVRGDGAAVGPPYNYDCQGYASPPAGPLPPP